MDAALVVIQFSLRVRLVRLKKIKNEKNCEQFCRAAVM